MELIQLNIKIDIFETIKQVLFYCLINLYTKIKLSFLN